MEEKRSITEHGIQIEGKQKRGIQMEEKLIQNGSLKNGSLEEEWKFILGVCQMAISNISHSQLLSPRTACQSSGPCSSRSACVRMRTCAICRSRGGRSSCSLDCRRSCGRAPHFR